MKRKKINHIKIMPLGLAALTIRDANSQLNKALTKRVAKGIINKAIELRRILEITKNTSRKHISPIALKWWDIIYQTAITESHTALKCANYQLRDSLKVAETR